MNTLNSPVLTEPGHRTLAEGRAMGRELRKKVPRSSHAAWSPAADRPDPIGLLQEQDRSRLAQFVPLRYERMVTSPFGFLSDDQYFYFLCLLIAAVLFVLAANILGDRTGRAWRAVRDGEWKLVSKHTNQWELFNMTADRTEMHNLAAAQADKVKKMVAMYDDWAKKSDVPPPRWR